MTHLHLFEARSDEVPQCVICHKRAHSSPSQIETWGRTRADGTRTGCRRKWKYSRVRPRVANRWAEFGTRAHKIREQWLLHGTWTPEIAESREGRCVAPGIPLWPVPGTCNAVEHTIKDTLCGVPWWMQADDVHGYVPGVEVTIGDLKTTGNFAYAKTTEDLADDAQRIAYAGWAATVLEVETVHAVWTYCHRTQPKAHPVRFSEGRDAIKHRLQSMVDSDVRPMLTANTTPLEDLPRDGLQNGTCQAFGGCPYKKECHEGVNHLDVLASRLSR